MCTRRFVGGPLTVLCILALVMGTASAAVISTTDSTSSPDTPPVHHHLSFGAIIDSLGKKGVDVTEVKADLQKGDSAAVKAWLGNYFQTHRAQKPEGSARSNPDLTNPTQQQEIITRLGEKGVDITEVKADAQSGDSAAVQAWLENYFQTHRPRGPEGSAPSTPDLTNATQQQEIITRLEEKGVDVTEAQADLQSGDTLAVKTWLESYVHSHEGEMPFHHHAGEIPGMSPDTGSGP
jgi:hypothetical protein